MTSDDREAGATSQPSAVRGRTEGDRGVVTLRGEIDYSNAGQLDAAMDRILTAGVRRVTVDFAEVSFVDSACLSALVRAREAAEEAGVELMLAAVGRPTRRVLDMTGLTSLFRIAEDGGDSGG
jgi:stage II sporulation protein AA (anti-sigma F factor antagonist)